MSENYYEVLGVSRDASNDDIKRAYRRLARELHPDVRPDDDAAAERFKAVSEAWAVLSDPEKRERYDRYGSDGLREGFDPGAYERARAGFGGGGGFGMGDLGDLFGQAGFGGFGGFRAGPTRGRDLTMRLDVPFEKAVRGFQTRFEYQQPVGCPSCDGAGVTSAGVCGTCRGRGTVEKARSLTVNVPRGAQTGDRLRLKGRGAAGRGGGPAGDVILELEVGDDPRFRREGRNLVTTVRIDVVDALVGTRVEVEGLDGGIRVRIPPTMRSGARLRVRGRGIERGGERGDLFVEVQIDGLQEPLTGEALEHAEALRAALGRTPAAASTSADGDDGAADTPGADTSARETEDAE